MFIQITIKKNKFHISTQHVERYNELLHLCLPLAYMPTFENQKSVQIMLFKKKRGTILTLLFNTTDKFVQEEEHLH